MDRNGALHLITAAGLPNTGPTVECTYSRFESGGTVFTAAPFDVAALGTFAVGEIFVDAQGEFALLETGQDPLFSVVEFTSITASGTIEWTRTLPGTGRVEAALLTGGDLIAARSGGERLRVDRTNGAVTALAPLVPTLDFVEDVLAMKDGGYVLQGTESPFLRRFVRCGPADEVIWSEEFFVSVNRDVPMTEGMSGRILYASFLEDFFFQGSGIAAQFSDRFNEPYEVSCEQPTPNSTGQTGKLRAVGSPDVSANELTLRYFELPPGQFLLSLASMESAANPAAGGSLGTLCLGGAIGRFPFLGQVTNIGTSRLPLNLTQIPGPSAFQPVLAGQTWYFQGWHRDFVGAPVSNFTNAIQVAF